MRPNRSSLTPLVLTLSLLGVEAKARANPIVESLKAGGIPVVSVPVEGSSIWAGRAMVILNAPTAIVKDLVTDVAAYKSFVPRTTASRKVGDGRYVIEMDLPWPVNKTWAYITMRSAIRDGIHVVQWKMLNGTLKRYEGVAWIQPWGTNRTLLTYQLLAVPNLAAPTAMMNTGLRDAAVTMLESILSQLNKVTARAARGNLQVAAQPSRAN
jgi:ribosome-associated toxin RatA of RatAB toxin-antitoxin module